MSVTDPFEMFRENLPNYIREVRGANSEAGKALSLLMLLRQTFGEIAADKAGSLIPELERYVKVRAGTVMVRGRIDALLGNLVIELKVDLNERRLEEAREQLRKYVAALWAIDGQRTNYMLMATDGLRFKVYKPTAPLTSAQTSPDDVALEEVNLMDIEAASHEDAFRWLDRYVLWRERIPPTTREMARDFGIGSPTFAAAMERLRKAWTEGREAGAAPFEEWSKYLSLVYGSPVGDESLFLKHTYLATLAKLMVYTYYSSGAVPSREEVRKVLVGEAFREWGIENFLEEDFFSWLVRDKAEKEGLSLAWELLKVLERYDLSKLTEDVLKGLYQSLVDPETRHDLGEYYTPEWLAEWIVNRLITDSKTTTLDPACGSGTFIVAAVRKKKQTTRMEPHLLLTQILASVKGIDVHPLAVLTSKANYLMALGDLVKYKAGRIHVPIYLANSIDFPTAKRDLEHGVEVYRYPVSERISVVVPKEAVDRGDISELLEAVTKFARTMSAGIVKADQTLFDEFIAKEVLGYPSLERGAKDSLWDTTKTLSRLIKAGKDSIYSFIIKNVYRPATLGRFDVVLGNPPWLSYRYVRLPDYQKKLKTLIIEKHKLLEKRDTKLLTHMELATLFFARAADLYLRAGGTIGFVMPRSVFTADNHERFRMNGFTPRIQFTLVADFDRSQQERLSPLFSVESCVVFGVKEGATKYPLACVQMAGSLGEKNLSLAQFEDLRQKDVVASLWREIGVVHVGERSSWSYESVTAVEALAPGRSPYMEKFRQGATLVPRPFWFVRAVSHPRFGADPQAPYVETTEHSSRMAKGTWRGARLSGKIESRFIFATLLGSDIFPFGHLPFRLVALPVVVSNRFKVASSSELSSSGCPHMHDWMRQAEALWTRGRGPKASRISLVQRIDYHRGLSIQNPESSLFLMYNTSGRRNLSASVVEIPSSIVVHSDGREYCASAFVAESSTYYVPVEKKDEGAYLAAFLNSSHTFELLRRIKATRHIHKKVWEVHLPQFRANDELHSDLAEAGIGAAQATKEAIRRESEKYGSVDVLSTGQVGNIRRAVREAISSQLAVIDDLTSRILRHT